MPALLLHMTLAKQAAGRSGAPATLVEAAARREDAFLLGSIFPDLPYHGRFGLQLLRHLAGREYLQSEWGDLFHTRGTGRLGLGLLRHLARGHVTGDGRAGVLALLAGYLCHHAVDRVVHPAINQLVERHRESFDLPSTAVHERIERIQSLIFHRDLLGHDILGTPYTRDLIGRVAGAGLLRPRLVRPLWRAVRGACLETHGRAPAEAELGDWLWGTTAYGRLMSSPLARQQGIAGDPAQARRSYYQGPDVDLVASLERGLDATVAAWHAARTVLRADRITAEVQEVFLHRVPEVDLGTGA